MLWVGFGCFRNNGVPETFSIPTCFHKPPVSQQFSFFHFSATLELFQHVSINHQYSNNFHFSTSQQPWSDENPQYSNNFHLFPLLSNPGVPKTTSIPTISTFSTSQQPWSAENPQYIVGILGVFCTTGLLRN